jgi:hypothetical protein
MTMRDVRAVLAIAFVGAVGPIGFQGTVKDAELARGSTVRIASSKLAAGWHDGTVTTASNSGRITCYGVSIKRPESKSGKAVVMFAGIDSIDLRLPQSAADSAAKKAPSWKRLDAKALAAKYPSCPPANP